MNRLRTLTAAAAIASAAAALAATPASDADKLFQSKVSQGGMYEVEASKLAVQRAHAQDVKDLALAEVHDHTLVGDNLKRISLASGLTFPATLNAEFAQRLSKLKAAPSAAFDAAYIADMQSIHDKDEKLFHGEAQEGSGDFKPFAAETDRIVKRHIGALNAN